MELVLVRHAEAEDPDGKRIKTDFDRPLTDQGRKQAKNLGKFLKKTSLTGSLLIASPLVRAQETAQILHNEARSIFADFETWKECGIPASWEELRNRLEPLKLPSAVLVGHMDEIAILAEKLLGATRSSLSFRKCAAALFRWEGGLRWQTARLKWWIDPEILSLMAEMGKDSKH